MDLDYALRAFATDLRDERKIVWPDLRLKMLAEAYEEDGKPLVASYIRTRLEEIYAAGDGRPTVGCIPRTGAPAWHLFDAADHVLSSALQSSWEDSK